MGLFSDCQNNRSFHALKASTVIFIATIFLSSIAMNSVADSETIADSETATATPQALLERMGEAFKKQNYEGRFFYLNGDNVRSVKIVHGVFDGIERERLVHLDGPPAEIVRNGNDIVCIHNGETVDRFEQKRSARIFPQRFAGQALLDFYDARLTGDDRIAGREAQRLRLIPKDRHRFGYVLWLDKESGLLLKSVLLNQEGKPLEIFQYSQLEVGVDIDPAEFQQFENSPFASMANETRNDVSAQWKVNWLPKGYKESSAEVYRVSSGGNVIQTLMYTDGLSAFTLFFEPSVMTEQLPPVTRKGPTVAISRKIDAGEPSVLVTIVGELPEIAAQNILSSIQWVNEE